MDLLYTKAMGQEGIYLVYKSSALRRFTAYTLPLSGTSSQAEALALYLRVILSPSLSVILTLNPSFLVILSRAKDLVVLRAGSLKRKNLIQGKLREKEGDGPPGSW
jgi:hypothetical protein